MLKAVGLGFTQISNTRECANENVIYYIVWIINMYINYCRADPLYIIVLGSDELMSYPTTGMFFILKTPDAIARTNKFLIIQ